MMNEPTADVDPRSFDRFAADYDRFVSLEPPELPEWLLIHLPRNRRRALDAGCGSGRHALALADHFDQVIGVDLSRPLVDIARRRRPHPRVRYEVADLLAFTDPDGFELVFSRTTLHHLTDLAAGLRRLRGLVAPGGVAVLVDCVSRWPTPARWVYVAGALRDVPGDVRRYGRDEARWLFGFRTSSPWLDHLRSERYLSRGSFEQRYGAVFPGSRFHALRYFHVLVWHRPEERP
jgi:SAM-dependent methyltransferase